MIIIDWGECQLELDTSREVITRGRKIQLADREIYKFLFSEKSIFRSKKLTIRLNLL